MAKNNINNTYDTQRMRSTTNSVPEALLLTDAAEQTAGMYACEVSGDYPFFKTKYVQKQMVVSSLPETGPTLSGLKEKYIGGEQLEANCTSPKSTPAPILTFYINDKKIAEEHTKEYRKLHFGNDLQKATKGLSIILTNDMIKMYKTNIKCTAQIQNVYNKMAAITVTTIPDHEARMIISQNQFVAGKLHSFIT
ncbi:hypothetical protein GQR58_005661 [Nymphon striatum]|nr:hypothetical protein GQR58_005661 [Nymphon striatum]